VRIFRKIAAICFVAVNAAAQAPGDFSGTWTLDVARSRIRQMPVAPPARLKIEQAGGWLTVTMSASGDGPSATAVYSLEYGKSEKSPVGDYTWNSATKWEGAALLVNTIVTGPAEYTQDDRWSRSADGHRLTIERTIRVRGAEAESVLVYEDGSAPAAGAAPAPLPREAPLPARDFVVASGTRILLKLTNPLNTKQSAAGDKVYLQTAAPVFVGKQLVIPVGSYVTGAVTESERAGRVAGKSGLNIRFESLTLPNGVNRDFRSRAGSVDTAGNLDKTEGRISGDSNIGGDAQTVAKTTAGGTGAGTLAGVAAGHPGMGAGIGAAAGALGGLARVFSTRGPDVVLPAGTTMEMVLDRDVQYSMAELPGR
jgi:type IV secretion system protein VirB10